MCRYVTFPELPPTIGVLLSGIHSGTLSGWVFLVAAFAGIFVGLRRARV
ncbi:hypothetical protein [Xanthobacter versatilis]